MSDRILPASERGARACWKKSKMSLSRAAKKAFKADETWGRSENGYPVVVSKGRQFEIAFAKRGGIVFAFELIDLIAYHPDVRLAGNMSQRFGVRFG